MDLGELDRALSIADGSVVLRATTLPWSGLDVFVNAFSHGELVIASASKTLRGPWVSITGKAVFAGAPRVPVEGTFSLDPKGIPVVLIRFEMPEIWQLASGFPDPDGDPPARSAVNDLTISGTTLVFTSLAVTDAKTKVPLRPGLNIVATLHLSAVSALIDAALTGTSTSLLYGTIGAPTGADLPPLSFDAAPWDAGPVVPGFSLKAPIPLDVTLGAVTLSDVRLQFYSPPSSTWLARNPSYRSRSGIAARLRDSLAGIDVEVTGELRRASESLTLSASITGVSLRRLGELFAFGDLLGGALPPEVNGFVESAGALALTGVQIAFSGGFAPGNVRLLGLTVRFPGASWDIFPSLSATVSSVQFMIVQPFGAASRSSAPGSGPAQITAFIEGVLKIAGQPLTVITEMPHFTVRADLPRGVTVPLGELIREQAPELPVPTALTLDELSVFVEPGASWTVSAAMTDDPGWSIGLGPVGLQIASVRLEASKRKGEEAQGSFSGLLILGDDLAVGVDYNFPPAALSISARLTTKIKLTRLVELLDESGLQLPAGFDPELSEPYLLIDADSNGERLTVSTVVTDLGTLAFTAQRSNGKTGAAVGIDLHAGMGMASVPGLEALQAVEDLVGLKSLMLLVSSLDEPGFQLPEMTEFGATKSVVLPPRARGLVTGLNIYAELEASRSKGLSALAGWLGISLDGSVAVTVAVSLPDPENDSKLFLAVDADLNSTTHLTGDLGVLMQGGEVGAFLSANVRTIVQGQPADFDVTATVLDNGVFVTGNMQGTLTFGPVTVSDVALVVGMDFEGIPTLGLAGTFSVPLVRFEGSLAIFFDSDDPAKSILAGSVSDMNIGDVARALTPGIQIPAPLTDVLSRVTVKGLLAFTMPATEAQALDGRDLESIAAAFQAYSQGRITIPSDSDKILLVVVNPGSAWHLTDLSTMTHYTLVASAPFYSARQPLYSQDEPPGSGGSGIDVSIDAQVYIAPMEVRLGDPTSGMRFPQGMQVEGELDLFASSARVRIVAQSSGISADAELDPIKLLNGDLLSVTGANGSGGPQLSLATFSQPQRSAPFRQPHFFLSAAIQILGLEQASTLITLTSSGLAFSATADITPVVNVGLSGTITSPTDMSASGSATVGLNVTIDLGPLGTLPFNDSVSGTVSVTCVSEQVTVSFSGSVNFQGLTSDTGSFDLPFSPGMLRQLDSLIEDEVVSLIEQAARSPERWLGWAMNAVIAGVGDVTNIADVLAQQFGETATQVASALSSVGYSLGDIAHGLNYGLALDGQDAYNAMMGAGLDAAGAASSVADEFSMSMADVAQMMKAADQPLQTIKGVLDSMGDPDAVAEALIGAGFTVQEVILSLGSLLGTAADKVAAVLKAAGIPVESITEALKIAGIPVESIANIMYNVFDMQVEAVFGVLKVMGIPAPDAAGAMRYVANLAIDEAGDILRKVYNLDLDDVSHVLEEVGYAAKEVGDWFSSTAESLGIPQFFEKVFSIY